MEPCEVEGIGHRISRFVGYASRGDGCAFCFVRAVAPLSTRRGPNWSSSADTVAARICRANLGHQFRRGHFEQLFLGFVTIDRNEALSVLLGFKDRPIGTPV